MTWLPVAFIVVVLACGEALFSVGLPRLSAAFKSHTGVLSWRGFALWVASSWLFGLIALFGYVSIAAHLRSDWLLYVGFLGLGLAMWLVRRRLWPDAPKPRRARLAITVGFALATASLILMGSLR